MRKVSMKTKMTVAKFKREAERVFLAKNPGAKVTGWFYARKVTFLTGRQELVGSFQTSRGDVTHTMIATGADDYIMVRA